MTSPALPSYENTKIQIETEMREFHPQPEYVHWVLRRNEQKLNANSNIVKKVYEDHLWKELCSTIS
jgi:DNA polymerase III epsilon subunit-like protein